MPITIFPPSHPLLFHLVFLAALDSSFAREMEIDSCRCFAFCFLMFLLFSKLASAQGSQQSETSSSARGANSIKYAKELQEQCQNCTDEKVEKKPVNLVHHHDKPSTNQQNTTVLDTSKLERKKLRELRKQNRTKELIQTNEYDEHMQMEAIERAKQLDLSGGGKYSEWMKEFEKPTSDKLLKIMKAQIILAKVYYSMARANTNTRYISDMLIRDIKRCTEAVGEATLDSELKEGASNLARLMGTAIGKARGVLYNCETMSRKLRAMVQATEDVVSKQKKKNLFLMEFVSFSFPKSLHCLTLKLTNDYYLRQISHKRVPNMIRFEAPSLYHYAIFSDNVLATWVVVNSTVVNAKDPEKHVFHIVTDELQYPAMYAWFYLHNLPAAVSVQSFDEFKWLNSSYIPVLKQIESEKLKEFYFKTDDPSSVAGMEERLKYKNPKYVSLLNHIRFYLPKLFPTLDKILFLDDDVVVQKDLTSLWDINMNGMVNAAVETCDQKKWYASYLNFSNSELSEKFDPHTCAWAYGMNFFDLKQWRKLNLTAVYHYWQDKNRDRQLWSLGTLPVGLLTFHKLTYPLDKSWHILGLGYRPSVNKTSIENSAVIHYNGNNKPWLDIGYAIFKGYWSKYVSCYDPYIQSCHFNV